ncbi:3'-5' exonuclease domain-containing protein 2 [Alloprevotella tannerae]|uniref:3'-5' exonuclease n=1 Tax=Alloprevotella tannerae TaxID=76122 RepID=UPI001ED9ECD0|nr:3'-5' exonuclease [Alloprevotella tannerae]MCG2653014.1 3'-5' exonuclease domain-containing protein 2 [Alloprevotella tannerae]
MRRLFVKTEKDFVTNLPRFVFNGEIKVIQRIEDVTQAVEQLSSSEILGIDTETRPSFRKGTIHKVALLQVANEDLCCLFQLSCFGFAPDLIHLLSNKEIKKVGLSLKDDFFMLSKRHKFDPQNCVDLQDYAKEMGIKDMSLQKLFANVFHQRISKSAQLSNWEAPIYTQSQKLYAATDAYACLKLYKELKRLKETNDYLLQ